MFFHLCEEDTVPLAQVTKRGSGITLLSGFKELFNKILLLMPLFGGHAGRRSWKEYFYPA